MSWMNETREEITFRSPSYVKSQGGGLIEAAKSAAFGVAGEFVALWRNNERTFEKKLGMFDPPHFQGTIVQDLGVKSTLYPLTVYFDGMYHHRRCARGSEGDLQIVPGYLAWSCLFEILSPGSGPEDAPLIYINFQGVNLSPGTGFQLRGGTGCRDFFHLSY